MKCKALCFLWLMTVTMVTASAQKRITLSAEELKNLVGCWQGTLEYSGTMIRKPFSTQANLIVKRISQMKAFQLVHIYTTDAGEQKCDTLHVSANGRKLKEATLLSKETSKKGVLTIVTQEVGKDRDYDQPVLIQTSFSICKSKYTYKKKIKPKDQSEWKDRENFTYVRRVCDKS